MSELKIQRSCINWFKSTHPEGWIWNTNDRWNKGIPDIFILLNGQHLFIELKTVKGRLSKAQIYVHKIIRSAGGRVEVVRTLGEFKMLIGWLELMKEGDKWPIMTTQQ